MLLKRLLFCVMFALCMTDVWGMAIDHDATKEWASKRVDAHKESNEQTAMRESYHDAGVYITAVDNTATNRQLFRSGPAVTDLEVSSSKNDNPKILSTAGGGAWPEGLEGLFKTCTKEGAEKCKTFYKVRGVSDNRCFCYDVFKTANINVSYGLSLIEDFLVSQKDFSFTSEYQAAKKALEQADSERHRVFQKLPDYPENMRPDYKIVLPSDYNYDTTYNSILTANDSYTEALNKLQDVLYKFRTNLHCNVVVNTRSTIDAPVGDDYIQCIYAEKKPDAEHEYENVHSFEFRFDDLTETWGRVTEKDLALSVASMHIYKPSFTTVSRKDVFLSDGRSLLKPACDMLNMHFHDYNMNTYFEYYYSNGLRSNNVGKCLFNTTIRRAGIDPVYTGEELFGSTFNPVEAFAEYQFGAGQNTRQMLEGVLRGQLGKRNDIKRIECDKTASRYATDDNLFQASAMNHIWQCTVTLNNGKEVKVDFVIDDISEFFEYEYLAVGDASACLENSGSFDGKSCQGVTEEKCREFGGMWDGMLCRLPNVETKEDVDRILNGLLTAGTVAGALASAVFTGGATVWVLTSFVVAGEVASFSKNVMSDNEHEKLSQAIAVTKKCIISCDKKSCFFDKNDPTCDKYWDSDNPFGASALVSLYEQNSFDVLNDKNLARQVEEAATKIYCTTQGTDALKKELDIVNTVVDLTADALILLGRLAGFAMLFKGTGLATLTRTGVVGEVNLTKSAKAVLNGIRPTWTTLYERAKNIAKLSDNERLKLIAELRPVIKGVDKLVNGKLLDSHWTGVLNAADVNVNKVMAIVQFLQNNYFSKLEGFTCNNAWQ